MNRKTQLAALAVGASIALVVLLSSGVGSASASPHNSTNTSYYNQSTSYDIGSWLPSDEATLDSTIKLVTRVGTFVVTGGSSTSVGAVLTGLMVFGAVISMIGGTMPGVVGGAVMGTFTIAALALAGYAAPWLWALTVFAIGVVLTTILIRALQ